MEMRAFVFFFIAIMLILVSCNGKKQQDINPISNQIVIPVVSEKEKANNILFVLDSIAKIKVDTSLIATTYNKSLFSQNDLSKAKQAFQQWRKNEISKSYYVSDCNKSENNGKDSLRYMLPDIPLKFNEDFYTCKADINFDGKQDVIFVFRVIDCLNGCGLAAQPPVHITFVSNTDKYVYDNFYIDKVETTITAFAEQLSKQSYKWIQIKNVSSEKGIIIISGNTFVHLDSDASCCPSIEFDFKCFIEKSGKGYININGVYKNQFEETEDIFKLKLKIK